MAPLPDVHPKALEEAQAGPAWYLRRSRSAGERFVAAIDRAIERIREAPSRWPLYASGTRRYVMLQFHRAVRADFRAGVKDAIQLHLRHEPTKGLERPQYRLRANEVRLFYDVTDETVEVLAIVTKEQAEAWLAGEGVPTPPSRPGENEG